VLLGSILSFFSINLNRERNNIDLIFSFLDSIDRISDKNYIPNDDDILRVRIPTTGIVQENFQLSYYRIQYETFSLDMYFHVLV
jgi:hypothetical protein